MPNSVRSTDTYIEMLIGGIWMRVTYTDIKGSFGSNAWIKKAEKALQGFIDQKIAWNELPIDDPARENDPNREDWFRDGTDLISREDIVFDGVINNGIFTISQRKTVRT